jgi:hypothetical protein
MRPFVVSLPLLTSMSVCDYCSSLFTVASTHRRIEIFLDRKRLEDGNNFQKDFLRSLASSTMVVPIISVDALQRLLVHDPSTVDNLLIEWIAAMAMIEVSQVKLILGIQHSLTAQDMNKTIEGLQVHLFVIGLHSCLFVCSFRWVALRRFIPS